MEESSRKVPNAQATTVGGGEPAAPSSMPAPSEGATPSEAARSTGGSATSSAGSVTDKRGRQQFGAFELAIVLSHFDIGTIEAIQSFPRGSRKAPKLILRTDTGLYLLKRRASGRDDAFKVAFCHALQLHLAERQFPLPHLVGTKNDNNSMLQWKGHIYELFEYIKGTSYDQSLEATQDAGKILALFHKLLGDYQPEYEPSHGSYHNARSVTRALNQLPTTLQQMPEVADERDRVTQCAQYLHASYNEAAQKAEDLGLSNWPAQIVHSDWHPGNMLFRGPRVVAVIDYDSARLHQRIIDAANGALQFSMLAKGEDPADWPDYVDESRFKRFLRGYDSVPDCVLSRAELRAIPHLMIEALVAESVIPIAATGQFARMNGANFLYMVERKVRWIQQHADALVQMVDQ